MLATQNSNNYVAEGRTTLLYGSEGLFERDGRFGFGIVCGGRHELFRVWVVIRRYKMPGQTDMS
jgi:hypothetical protein